MPCCRWAAHAQSKATLEAVKLVGMLQPASIIWENVMGFSAVEVGHFRSPMQYVRAELEKLGYVSEVYDLCPSLLMSFVRQRTGRGRYHLARGLGSTIRRSH